MEAQGVPVTIANLAIHRHREEEMNRERMRHNQTVQEAAAERVREAKKGKAREVVPDSEEEESEEMYSSPLEEWDLKYLYIRPESSKILTLWFIYYSEGTTTKHLFTHYT
ncbi:hypothetical protein PIB30_042618 [Stylosanthes scabra]|uniref:Uncharacterized protein n=1 Tax=Stylosanthes scabra TaxID=79078 RepID=A0ABU6XGK5_9FABA|nr:hypothetical protein [Stylosanthes scabra]